MKYADPPDSLSSVYIKSIRSILESEFISIVVS